MAIFKNTFITQERFLFEVSSKQHALVEAFTFPEKRGCLHSHPPPTWLKRGSTPPFTSEALPGLEQGHPPPEKSPSPLLACPCSPATRWGHGHGAGHPSIVTPWQPAYVSLLLLGFSFTLHTCWRDNGQQNLIPFLPFHCSASLHLEGKRNADVG